MHYIDWFILIGYFIFAFLIGVLVTKKAGKGIESYFGADRSLPWWWIGISILATTFAADTPLAITGITANQGISGNWIWWNWAITYILVAVFFAARWHKSEVLTDVEFIELRYDGPQARFLRGFKAIYFGLVINCFILGWVITAVIKIARPFIRWDTILGKHSFEQLQEYFPDFLLISGDLNTSITIILILCVVVAYSSLGGIRGVILTDLFQFFLAMGTSILFAVYAVRYVGGLDVLFDQMEILYGQEKADRMLRFFPSISWGTPFYTFVIYVLIQWWARFDADGTGYIAQRINTAKSVSDASKGALLFSIGFIALRTWPWIIVALVTMVVFPIHNPSQVYDMGILMIQEGGTVDRELGYPLLMKLILPVGLLGLTFTSLMAAFMSTVDTHLNWGTSYMINDVYKRFIYPKASQRHMIRISRIGVIILSITAIWVSTQMSSIEQAWKYFINMASGVGIAQILRWVWWRSNAWTEISGMVSAMLLTVSFSILAIDWDSTYQFALIALLSTIISLMVTVCTSPVKSHTLSIFVNRVKPIGFWKKEFGETNSLSEFLKTLGLWGLGVLVAYGLLFGIGYILTLHFIKGSVVFLFSIVGLAILFFIIRRFNLSLEN